MIERRFPAREIVRLVSVDEASTEDGLTTVCGMIASQDSICWLTPEAIPC